MRLRLVLLTGLLLSACAHRPMPMPAWVPEGTSVITEPPIFIRGVGNSLGIHEKDQRPEAARVRAGAALARTLDKIAAALVPPSPANADLSQALTLFMARAFKTQTNDVWTSDDGVTYALAQLDYASFRATFEKWVAEDAPHRSGLTAKLDAVINEMSAGESEPPHK